MDDGDLCLKEFLKVHGVKMFIVVFSRWRRGRQIIQSPTISQSIPAGEGRSSQPRSVFSVLATSKTERLR